MNRSDRDWLLDAVNHLEFLQQYVNLENREDQVVLDAIAMRLSAAIDSVSHISEKLRSHVFTDAQWRDISGTRNRIAHGYGFVDAARLTVFIERDVPDFDADIRRLLEQTLK